MTLIHVPRPRQSALDPDRPINALLKAQIEQLHEAETALPLHLRTTIFVKAIKTEGEAANYIRAVTEAIHKAHADVKAQRGQRTGAKGKRVIEIAAIAAEEAERTRTNRARTNRARSKKTKSRAKAMRSRKNSAK